MSYIASTGRHRQPSGQDVLGGICVPVVPGAACGTLPVARPEAEGGEQVPAHRAGLGRGVPAVHGHRRAASALRFVLQHGPQFRPPGAGDRTGKMPVADHIPHGQVLHSNHVVRHGHRRGVKRGHVHPGPGPHERDGLANLRQPQHSAAHGERTAGVGGGLAPPIGLEPRVPGAAGEERLECGVLVAERLLERDRRHLIQERPLGLALHRGQRPVGFRVASALAFAGRPLVPHCEGAVPHHPDAPKRAGKYRLLSRVRVRPTPVGRPHAYRRTLMAVKLWKARHTGFLPALKDGACARDFR